MNQLDDNKQPLVTFALFAYNQERFIREAVEGALLQTYSPLEIILSDDCSKDMTFEIIQEMVDGYKGSHKITLNRNDCNYGIANHTNKVISMAAGELIVMAAGDDISFPGRTRVIVKNWLLYNKPTALQSSHSRINEYGEVLVEDVLQLETNIYEEASYANLLIKAKDKEKLKYIGAASAYSRSCFNEFGPIPDYVVAEDGTLAFRALFLNGILHIKDVLVRYRIHEDNITQQHIYLKNMSVVYHEKLLCEKRKLFLSVHCSRLHDLKHALKFKYIDDNQHKSLERAILRRDEAIQSIVNWWTSSYFVRISKHYKNILRWGNEKEKKWVRVRLLPMPLFVLQCHFKKLYRKLKNFIFH